MCVQADGSSVRVYVFRLMGSVCVCVCVCVCRLMGSMRPSFVCSQQEDGVLYHHAFQGGHLVAWMLNNQEATTRDEAVETLHFLLQKGVLRHGECV